jgi:hypothetical protein
MFVRLRSAASRLPIVTVLLIGAVFGATLGSPALARLIGLGHADASTMQTRSVSCNAYAFQPVDSATGADYFNAKRIRAGTGGSGFFSCDLPLPARAVVTKVQISIWDGSGSSEVKYCGLYRSGLDASTFDTVQEMAAMPATGIAQAPGFARLEDATIGFATVDPTKYVYWVQCNLGQAGQSLGLFGADVLFKISTANG